MVYGQREEHIWGTDEAPRERVERSQLDGKCVDVGGALLGLSISHISSIITSICSYPVVTSQCCHFPFQSPRAGSAFNASCEGSSWRAGDLSAFTSCVLWASGDLIAGSKAEMRRSLSSSVAENK